MDNVPVKISEKYKPPPRLYQLPQSVANKLLLPAEHYTHSPLYSYDFHLERKVLTKLPEWRRMRQLERNARRERKEKREQQRMRAVEAQQKELLGAVSYPSAEEFSSTDSEDDDGTATQTAKSTQAPAACDEELRATPAVISQQTFCFDNILQPTILPRKPVAGTDNVENQLRTVNGLVHAGPVLSAESHLLTNAFNYKDFENDTSSPFDNIELKTINDLDILAQCLHNTQLTAQGDPEHAATEAEEEKKENTQNSVVVVATTTAETAEEPLDIVENNKAALQKVDFPVLSQDPPENEHIPATALVQNNYFYAPPSTGGYNEPYASQQQQSAVYMPYNEQYGVISHHQQQRQQQDQFSNFNLNRANYANQNNLLYTPNCNGASTAYYTTMQYLGHNANSYLGIGQAAYNEQHMQLATATATPTLTPPSPADAEAHLKSKSVPDILKELSDEVRNSEMRRSRNYSYNLDDDTIKDQATPRQPAANGKNNAAAQQTPTKAAINQHDAPSQCYANLEAAAQVLAKNISSMGFPLERVAKIAQIYGADDKKIIEHLIPLSELMDLGFDETKISEALIKFDNNKDKALDYLIS